MADMAFSISHDLIDDIEMRMENTRLGPIGTCILLFNFHAVLRGLLRDIDEILYHPKEAKKRDRDIGDAEKEELLHALDRIITGHMKNVSDAKKIFDRTIFKGWFNNVTLPKAEKVYDGFCDVEILSKTVVNEDEGPNVSADELIQSFDEKS
jgi:hypothetical protein